MKIATTTKAASAAAVVRSPWQMSLSLARTMSSYVMSVTAAPSPPSAQPVGKVLETDVVAFRYVHVFFTPRTQRSGGQGMFHICLQILST